MARPKKPNGTLNGMGIGAAVGIASIFALVHAKTKGSVYLDEEGAGILLGEAILGAGIGGLVGAIVEESIKGDRLLYRAR